MAKRRGNGEGSIYRRSSDKRWLAVMTTRDPETGKVVRRTVSGRTRAEAHRRLVVLRGQLEAGARPASRWIEAKAAATCTSRCVSTPPVICRRKVVIVIPSFQSVGVAPHRSGRRTRQRRACAAGSYEVTPSDRSVSGECPSRADGSISRQSQGTSAGSFESDLARASTHTLTGVTAEVVDRINARFNPRCRLGGVKSCA